MKPSSWFLATIALLATAQADAQVSVRAWSQGPFPKEFGADPAVASPGHSPSDSPRSRTVDSYDTPGSGAAAALTVPASAGDQVPGSKHPPVAPIVRLLERLDIASPAPAKTMQPETPTATGPASASQPATAERALPEPAPVSLPRSGPPVPIAIRFSPGSAALDEEALDLALQQLGAGTAARVRVRSPAARDGGEGMAARLADSRVRALQRALIERGYAPERAELTAASAPDRIELEALASPDRVSVRPVGARK